MKALLLIILAIVFIGAISSCTKNQITEPKLKVKPAPDRPVKDTIFVAAKHNL